MSTTLVIVIALLLVLAVVLGVQRQNKRHK